VCSTALTRRDEVCPRCGTRRPEPAYAPSPLFGGLLGGNRRSPWFVAATAIVAIAVVVVVAGNRGTAAVVAIALLLAGNMLMRRSWRGPRPRNRPPDDR
jgi:hypothetical protein